LVLAGFGAAIGLAAPAQADPNGDFLAALNYSGITYTTDRMPSGSANARAS
jgi:hypothetical protein